MKIFDINNDEILDVIVSDKSYRVREITGDNVLFLFFALPHPLEVPLYSYCDFQGRRYILQKEEHFKKIHTENHEFTLEMHTCAAYLHTQKFEFFTLQNDQGVITINSPREIEFTLHLTPREYIQLLVDNMNQKDRDGGWQVGDCIEGNPVLIDFNDTFCSDALPRIADAFKTEWEIDGKTIHLRKVEKERENPLPLAYGKGRGLLPGIGRTNYKNRIAVVRVKTSDRNINRAAYGSKTLCMPKNHTIEYKGIQYVTDSTGSTITRKTPIINAPVLPEETLDLTHIYPHKVGTVSTVVAVDDAQGLYDFTDATNNIDYKENMIPGETATVIFQSGKINGTELEISDYAHSGRRFELAPLTEHGVTIPQGTLIPSAGDTYAVFHINLPQEYITLAETEALNEAVKFLHENEQSQFTYSVRLDGIFAKRRWLEIGGKINPGNFVRLTDPQYLTEPVDIRITSVKDFVNYPYSPEITLSNSVTGKTMGSVIRQLPNQEQTIERTRDEAVRYSRLRFRDVQELALRLQDSLLNFTGAINPISIHAMMAYLGEESLQFCWVDDKTSPQEIDHAFNYNAKTTVFSTPAGVIQHQTIDIDTLAPAHNPDEYRYWDISAYTSPALAGQGALWLYLKCKKNGTTGTFLLSADAIDLNADADYYHFLTGHLNSELRGERSFIPLYGFSMWTPGMMRVNKVVNIDGSQYWDMLNKLFRIGDDGRFLSYTPTDGLRLKGVMTQSPSGDTDYLGVDRGNYVSGTVYYPGDLVKYASDGNVYKCLQQTNTVPTNATYWKLMISKGDKGNTGNTGNTGATGATGNEGQGYKYAYYSSDSLTPPPTPPNAGYIPAGWGASPGFYGKRYIYVSQCISTNGSWSAWTAPVIYSVAGEDGDPGPAIVYRGEFSSGNTYYNNAARRDVVKYGGTYYIYKGSDAASGSWNAANWENFGAQFSSVATDLLLAVNANVGGWIFKNERLESQSGGMYLDGKNGKISSNSSGSRIEIDSQRRALWLVDSSGREVGSWQFITGASYLTVYFYDSDGTEYTMQTNGARITIYRESVRLYQFSATGMEISPSLLPTSGNALPSGRVYRDSDNNLKIVP
ncbi:MAG: hypothetical protein LBS05_00170 [Tannerellaceae bacterium]|jgi:hypothetical protein|nr:hypothetical protein [Tannerellaceae bacterium]